MNSFEYTQCPLCDMFVFNNFIYTVSLEDIMDAKTVIQACKDLGLKAYIPQNKDSGFLKLYRARIPEILPRLSGNSIKVFLALSYGLEWDSSEVAIPIETLCKITNLERRTVRACLDELERNLVIKRFGPNIRRSYVISNCYVRLGKNNK